MSGSGARRQLPRGECLHSPLEVARVLQCSEWWVKEQARKRRIPFAWIGGSYRFTAEHVNEIIRLCEVRPGDGAPQVPALAAADRRDSVSASESSARLRERAPRRAVRSGSQSPTAA
jgi:hypothetical protein